MDIQEYWNTVDVQKSFEDPLYTHRLAPLIPKEAHIIEYGCGYGRLLEQLRSEGYTQLVGYDFAPAMIERGRRTYPHLELHALEKSGHLPCPAQSADLIILSTVLCTLIEKEGQQALIGEVERVLKPGGYLYLSDFLVCDHPRYQQRYREAQLDHGEWGLYTTSEGLTVRHHTTQWITDLLHRFDLQWLEQFDFKTMNSNPARTIHCLAKKVALRSVNLDTHNQPDELNSGNAAASRIKNRAAFSCENS